MNNLKHITAAMMVIIAGAQSAIAGSYVEDPYLTNDWSINTNFSSDEFDASALAFAGAYSVNLLQDNPEGAHAGHDHHFDTKRVDAHAPIGVMGDHTHKTGEVMLSYRYMTMRMEGNRNGDKRLSNAQVRGKGFMVVPDDMTMQMHMFGAMYAPSDNLTLMAMISYKRKSMNHVAGAPLGSVNFKTTSEGIGDLKLSGLYQLQHDAHHTLHATFGVSLPTGSVNEGDNTPSGRTRLPYAMQLGSGTVDVIMGLTYTYQADSYSAGLQSTGTVRLGHNRHEYSLGDTFDVSAWYAIPVGNEISLSARARYSWWDNIDGADPLFVRGGGGQFMAPTMDPSLRGGQRIDMLVGVNVYFKDGPLKGNRLAIEGGVPVYQYLEGPQLETDWLLMAGWQLAF